MMGFVLCWSLHKKKSFCFAVTILMQIILLQYWRTKDSTGQLFCLQRISCHYSGTSLSNHLTKILINSFSSQIAISETSRKRPPLISDHLTKILIGSSVSQIAISETPYDRPPPVSDHQTKISIGSFVSQITISETSHKRPPKPHIKGGHLQGFYCIHNPSTPITKCFKPIV